jgi:RNA polymerase sigma-70 factor, ECF subfamily
VATSTQETLWVIRAQCGDREALELVLRSVQPSLNRYILRLVGPSSSDDVLQEVLIAISRKLKWLHTPELFQAWAYRIASRAAFRHLRNERRWPEQTHDDSLLENVAAPEIHLPDAFLHDALNSDGLTPASRAVLLLHFQEELSLPEVAAILEIPLGTVKSRLAYGLMALRKQFKEKRSL